MFVPGQKGTIKHLDILLEGRSLKDIVIVDIDAYKYKENLLNGIPMKQYLGCQADSALITLKDFLLHKILPAEDVR